MNLCVFYNQIFFIFFLSPLLYSTLADDNDSIDSLKRRKVEVESKLTSLPQLTLRTGVGNAGWFSRAIPRSNKRLAVEISLPAGTEIDLVVLVPTVWNHSEIGPSADGLPVSFEIFAGLNGENGTMIASRKLSDDQFNRIAPITVPVTPQKADWIRIVSTELVPHARTEKDFLLKFSEIMVFDGHLNAALWQPVKVPSVNDGGWGRAAIFKDALVDGLTPYLMDGVSKKRNQGFMLNHDGKTPINLRFDLGSQQHIQSIRLHTAYIYEYVPNIQPAIFGVPKKVAVFGSEQADFKDESLLFQYERESIYHVGNIMEWRLKTPKKLRYLRFHIPKDQSSDLKKEFITLDEIEAISTLGENLLKGKTPQISRKVKRHSQNTASLTDGQNHFGELLPTRKWMEQLALRHDLELELQRLIAQLETRYGKQRKNIYALSFISAALFFGVVGLILINRLMRVRAVQADRNKIATNLHDELSANLHALSLLSEMAKKNINSQSKLVKTLDHIQTLSQENRKVTRNFINLIRGEIVSDNLVEQMDRLADRVLMGISHNLEIKGDITQISKRTQNELFLFYKECLINIARHAAATECHTKLSINGLNTVCLEVTDNGVGVASNPKSLSRRAKLLKGQLATVMPPAGGTQIVLKCR